MTPDMKRLCEAVGPAVEQTIIDAGNNRPPDLEAIVRAVLIELREASPAVIEAGRWPAEDDGPAACLAAMIDHVLAGPATA